MTKKLHQETLENLSKYGIEVADHFPNTFNKEFDIHIIIIDRTLIEVNNNEREISLSFHVGTEPDKSASLSLMLNKIPNTNVTIAELFDKHHDTDDLLTGDEAVEHYYKKIHNQIITNYLQEQSDMQYLATTEAPQC